MTEPRVATPTRVASYEHGGYVFHQHNVDPIPEQAIAESTFKDALKRYNSARFAYSRADRYATYLSMLPQGEKQVAVSGLCEAITRLSAERAPITVISGGEKPLALIGNLHDKVQPATNRSVNGRGAHSISAFVTLTRELHPPVRGDFDSIIDIDRNRHPVYALPSFTFDSINYLPTIDGTGDYIVRYCTELDTIAVGDAVRPVLIERDLAHVWHTFISSNP